MLAATLATSTPALAQSTSRIVGTVQDSAGQRIADAEIVVDGERRVRTDSDGRFEIGGLSTGSVSLRARRIGFYPDQRDVLARAGETTLVTIVLRRRPVMLDTISVSADCSRFRFDGFTCRRRTGKGVYLDVDAIDSINPRFPVEVFRGEPGFRVDASRRGLIVVATSGWRCLATLVNGYPPSLANPRPTWPNEMIGVEIYRDPDDAPEQYKMYVAPPKRCSLIIYWTQVKPRR